MGSILSGQPKDEEEKGEPTNSPDQSKDNEERGKSTNSSGQSKDKEGSGKSRGMDERGKKHISYSLLGLAINDSTEKATCRVKIPSDELSQYDDPVGVDPLAVLVVKNEDDTHCINLMRECSHRNILRALVIADKGHYFEVWTESFTGLLVNYLHSTALGAMSGQKIMLPTPHIQSAVSQIFDGLEHLRLLGKYHGNFSLENTYYDTLGGEIVVKLTDFKLRDTKSVLQCQAEDCQAVGDALQSISKAADLWKAKDQCFDCYQIDHLAKKLKEFSRGDLPYIKQDIRGHPFFWDFNATKFFFVSEIPFAMNSQAFRNKVEACEELCSLPWCDDGYAGFVQQMDKYRLRKKIDKYDKNSRVSYVRFLSGLYVHEKEMEGRVSVDTAVRKRNPRVFLILYNLISRPPRHKKEI